MLTVALAAALVAAAGYGSASVLQALAARRAAAGTTYRHPWYVAGTALDTAAWLVSLVALRTLPVYEVQSILALSVAVTVVLARFVLGTPVRRADAVPLLAAVAGLALLSAASAPVHRAPTGAVWEVVVVAAAPAVLLAGVAVARQASPATPAALLAGAGFGITAVCAQELPLPSGGWTAHAAAPLAAALAADPLTWALIVSAVAGTWLYSVALEHGDVGRVTALLWISEVLVPSAVAAGFLHEAFRPGWTAAGLGAVALILATVVLLGPRKPATTVVP